MAIDLLVNAPKATAQEMYSCLSNAGVNDLLIVKAVNFLEGNFGNQLREADSKTPVTIGHLYPSVVRAVDYLTKHAPTDKTAKGTPVPHVEITPVFVAGILLHDVLDDYAPLKDASDSQRRQLFTDLFGQPDGSAIYKLVHPLSGWNWKDLPKREKGIYTDEGVLRLQIERDAVTKLENVGSWPSDLIKIVERSTNLDWLPIAGKLHKTACIIAKTAEIFLPFVTERSRYWAGQYNSRLDKF